MDNDDRPIGRLLTRREVLALMGGAGAALLGEGLARAARAAESLPAGCVVRPEQTEGPYFVDLDLERNDIRSDRNGSLRAGVPLEFSFKVTRLAGVACKPLPNAVVDVWHCDAKGLYSGVDDVHGDTRENTWLRGFQRTNAQGIARFTTIYPGWYPGRPVHIHFKIRSGPDAKPGFDFTSQLYFDDALTDRIHGRAPYEKGGRTRNDRDGIYRRNGSQLLLHATSKDGRVTAPPFEIALQV